VAIKGERGSSGLGGGECNRSTAAAQANQTGYLPMLPKQLIKAFEG
jgi:hypothetical protein